MAYIAYNTPEELKEEEQIILQQIEIMKNAFIDKVNAIEKRKQEKRKQLRDSITYNYSLRLITISNKDWFIIHRDANITVEEEQLLGKNFSKESWSTPFDIVNTVFFFSQDNYKSTCHMDINALLPKSGEIFTREELDLLINNLNPQI